MFQPKDSGYETVRVRYIEILPSKSTLVAITGVQRLAWIQFIPTACQMAANSFIFYYFTFIIIILLCCNESLFHQLSRCLHVYALWGWGDSHNHTHWYAGRQAIVCPCLLYRVGHQLPCRNLSAAPAGELLATGYLNRKYLAMFSRSRPTCKW